LCKKVAERSNIFMTTVFMSPCSVPGTTGSSRSYFQNFTLIENLPGGSSSLTIRKGGREYTFDENVDFIVSRATLSTKIDVPVVFVGYGIIDKANGINDFAGVDVRGKIILRLRQARLTGTKCWR
jgi:hypothetical protein